MDPYTGRVIQNGKCPTRGTIIQDGIQPGVAHQAIIHLGTVIKEDIATALLKGVKKKMGTALLKGIKEAIGP